MGYFPTQGFGAAAAAEKGTVTFSSWHFLLGTDGWDGREPGQAGQRDLMFPKGRLSALPAQAH